MAREIDEWVVQGEKVIEQAMERLRKSDIADDLRRSARSTRQAAKAGTEMAAQTGRATIEAIDPDEPLTVNQRHRPAPRRPTR